MKEKKITKIIMPYVLVFLGSVLYAAGFQFFLYPNSIVVGGLTGISMIINYITGLPVGVMIIIMNIPLFAWAWRKFGFNFMLMSLLGTFISSALVDVFAMFDINITDQPLLACIYGGLIKGAGLGLIYQANGSTGGVDIIAKFLRQKYRHINFGTFLLMLDVVVIFAFAVCFNRYDSGMYAIIAMYIASKVVDLVLYGAINSKVCFVISDASDDIKTAITGRLGRGVTMLHGEGAYSGRDKQVILCVIKQQQIVEIRQIIKEYDENAFVIISDSHEVFGKGFTSIHDNK
jgi:uncharacterized membrane-anchored protein YitT (DUF2179 family)